MTIYEFTFNFMNENNLRALVNNVYFSYAQHLAISTSAFLWSMRHAIYYFYYYYSCAHCLCPEHCSKPFDNNKWLRRKSSRFISIHCCYLIMETKRKLHIERPINGYCRFKLRAKKEIWLKPNAKHFIYLIIWVY